MSATATASAVDGASASSASRTSDVRSRATRSASGNPARARYVGCVENGCSELCNPNSIPVGRHETCGTTRNPDSNSESASASASR